MSNLFFKISLRSDGSMKLNNQNDSVANRQKFLKKISLNPNNIVSAELAHGNRVAIVGNDDLGTTIPQTDSLITNQKGIFLSITVADCLPIVLYNEQQQLIALLHAGWQGLDKEIIKEAVSKIKKEFQINPESLSAYIGPGIETCHYEVKKDLVDKFSTYDATKNRNGKYFLNLKKIAKKQLINLGIKSANVKTSSVCTYCQSDKYFSFRKDKTRPVQAMMVVAGFKF